MVGAQGIDRLVDDELAMREDVPPIGYGDRDVDVLLDQQYREAALLCVIE